MAGMQPRIRGRGHTGSVGKGERIVITIVETCPHCTIHAPLLT